MTFAKTIASAFFATAFGLATQALAAGPVILNTYIEANQNTIRLGDIFQGAGPYKDRVIAQAPKPGEELILDRPYLTRLAQGFRLDWKAFPGNDSVVISRPVQHVSQGDIKDAIRGHIFATQGTDDMVNIKLRESRDGYILPKNTQPTLRISDFNHDPISGQFTAIVNAPAYGTAEARFNIAGQLIRMVEIPVLARTIRRHDVITSNDIDFITVPASQFRHSVIASEDDLVGMSATRRIDAGKPVQHRAVTPPILVKKNKLVTLQLNAPGIQLTAQGKALEDGSKNDIIRVENSQSKIVVEAIVSGPGRATVSILGTQVAQGY